MSETNSPRRRVLLGVSAGIAAYKACDVCRELHRAGCDVQVVMSPGATRFVTPLTFSALSGRRTLVDLFDSETSHRIDHIELGRWCEVLAVAPSTMDFIGKIANGLADDLLTNTVMACPREKPVLFVPAMNTRMWEHPLFRANLNRLTALREDGFRIDIVDPVSKELACREEGEGAFPPVETVVDRILRALD